MSLVTLGAQESWVSSRPMGRRARRGPVRGGFTLAEVLVGALIGAVIAGGTMAAFVTAARLMRAQSNPDITEVTSMAEQTLESRRNFIGCDSPWFDPTTCTPAGGLPTTWQDAPLVDGQGQPYPPSSPQSILADPTLQRRYCVTPQDCDGNGATGDCFSVQAKVCWNGTACPAVGSPC